MRLLTDDRRAEWDAFVGEAPQATLYHLSGWKGVIERSFGHRTHYLMSLDGAQLVKGILPLVHLKSRLFGSFLVSLPYFNYGGACAVDEATARGLLADAVELARELGAEHIELRHTHNSLPELPVKQEKVSMRLALPSDPELLFRSFDSKLRSQIRRPQKEGMVASIGGAEELDAFYAVFSENMRDLGTPVYGKAFFRNILETFPDRTWIGTVRDREGRPVAAGFLVEFRGVMEVPWASSLRRFNRFSPNMLLYWRMLSWACERRCGIFDFGRSTVDEATFRFKQQWGAQPMGLYWHYWLRDSRPLPALNPANPKYKLAIEVWRRLPLALTRLIGPAIVKNLP